MKISPNYKYRHVCHFCGKNTAIKGYEVHRGCYYIENASHYSGVYHSVKYHKIIVDIPQCRKCNKIDRKISLVCLYIGLIIFVISTYIWSGIFAETEHNSTRSLGSILTACLPSILIALVVGGAIAFVIRLWLERKWSHNSYCDDYAPIKKLVEIGFEPRDNLPNLKNTKVQGRGSLEMSKLREVIADVIATDHCAFEN